MSATQVVSQTKIPSGLKGYFLWFNLEFLNAPFTLNTNEMRNSNEKTPESLIFKNAYLIMLYIIILND